MKCLEGTLNCLRLGVRFPVQFPVKVAWKNGTGKKRHMQGEIVTMSGNGVFMRVPSHLAPNTKVTLTVTLPTEATRVPLKLRCQARIVHGSENTNLPFGIGAVIDDYRIQTASRRAALSRA